MTECVYMNMYIYTYTHTHTYIYIYIYIEVVCTDTQVEGNTHVGCVYMFRKKVSNKCRTSSQTVPNNF